MAPKNVKVGDTIMMKDENEFHGYELLPNEKCSSLLIQEVLGLGMVKEK